MTIVANHYISDKPYCELLPMAGSDKALVWVANDFSEGKGIADKFAAKFATVESIFALWLCISAEYI